MNASGARLSRGARWRARGCRGSAGGAGQAAARRRIGQPSLGQEGVVGDPGTPPDLAVVPPGRPAPRTTTGRHGCSPRPPHHAGHAAADHDVGDVVPLVAPAVDRPGHGCSTQASSRSGAGAGDALRADHLVDQAWTCQMQLLVVDGLPAVGRELHRPLDRRHPVVLAITVSQRSAGAARSPGAPRAAGRRPNRPRTRRCPAGSGRWPAARTPGRGSRGRRAA